MKNEKGEKDKEKQPKLLFENMSQSSGYVDEDSDLYNDPDIVASLNRARKQMENDECIPSNRVFKDV
ncbi:MAG: hypothetical protein OXN17_02830 [Candidatus Poribacteria bacterium]|nr:hypothetical protein [Candidatus Poribacteria bacterium]